MHNQFSKDILKVETPCRPSTYSRNKVGVVKYLNGKVKKVKNLWETETRCLDCPI